MQCPRCHGEWVLRTRDHDELAHVREPFACASCGLCFDHLWLPVPEQIGLFDQSAAPYKERVLLAG